MDTAAHDVLELYRNVDSIRSLGHALIECSDIEPDFFDEKPAALVFAAIAKGFADGTSRPSRKAFLRSSLTTLTHQHSIMQMVFYAREQQASVTDKQQHALYDEYTDREMTDELQACAASGELDGVRERLGLSADTERPFRILVLDVGSEFAHEGMADREEPDRLARTKDFMTKWAMPANEELPPAWATVPDDGVATICIPKPLAMKIVDPSVIRNSAYKRLDADRAILEHEYVHTQVRLLIANGLIGIMPHELAAEEFSGNLNGYQNMKSLAGGIEDLTGYSMMEDIRAVSKGEISLYDMYAHIANAVGLEFMLQIAMCSAGYGLRRPNVLRQQINAYTGSYTKIGDRMQIVRTQSSKVLNT